MPLSVCFITRVTEQRNGRQRHRNAELNAAIRELLVKYNNYVFQLASYSRRKSFLPTEKPYLKPLAATPYGLRQYRMAKVQKMGYIFLSEDTHYYILPYRLTGKYVEVRNTDSVVEIFYNHKKLCTVSATVARKISHSKKTFHQLAQSVQRVEPALLPAEGREYRSAYAHTVNYIITRIILQHSYPAIGY